MHMKQYSSLGQAIFDCLGNSGRKDPDIMFTRKKDPDPKPPFSKDPLSGAFSKSSNLGRLSVFKKLRIREDTCDRFFVSGSKSSVFEKIRVRVHVALDSKSYSTKFGPMKSSHGAGPAATHILKRFADRISERHGNSYSETVMWLRTKLPFALLRSSIMCLRGSRPHRSRVVHLDAIQLATSEAGL